MPITPSSRRYRIGLPLILLSALILLFALGESRSPFSSIRLIRPGHSEEIEPFPFVRNPLPGAFTIECIYTPPTLPVHTFRIIPDDLFVEMSIDGRAVDLSSVPEHQLSDWGKGFSLPVPKGKKGSAELRFRLVNRGGPGGLHVSAQSPWVERLLFLGVVLGAWGWTLRTRQSLPYRIIFVAGAAWAASIWISTPFTMRGHDVMSHLEYIRYLIDHRSLPPPFGGWEFHQPPLYYLLTAPLLLWGETFSLFEPYKTIQLLSLLCWLGFVAVGYEILRRLLPRRRWWRYTLFALLAFWPGGMIHAPRLGNDPLFYLLCASAFLSIMVWWEERRGGPFVLASGLTALTLAAKGNGLIPLAVLGILLVASLFLRRLPSPRALIAGGGLIAAGLFILFSESLFWALRDGHSVLMGETSRGLHHALTVENSPRNYLLFEPITFLTSPYADPWRDEGGRQQFWNYLLRTSLSGEFRYSDRLIPLARAMGAALLLLVIGAVTALLRHRRELFTARWLPVLLMLFFSIAALAVFRHGAPAACHNDFRLIFPVLLPAIGLLGLWGNEEPKRGDRVVRILLAVPIATMIISSAAFWIAVAGA